MAVFAEYWPCLTATSGAIPTAWVGIPPPAAAAHQRDGDDELPLAERSPVGAAQCTGWDSVAAPEHSFAFIW